MTTTQSMFFSSSIFYPYQASSTSTRHRLDFRYLSNSLPNPETESEAQQVSMHVFHLLSGGSRLKSMAISLRGDRRLGFELSSVAGCCWTTLTSVELVLDTLSDDAYEIFILDALQACTCLEQLTIRNKKRKERNNCRVSLDWLTPDLPICRTLKSLELINMEKVLCVSVLASSSPSTNPIAFFRSLRRLVIAEPMGLIEQLEHKLNSEFFGAVCDAVAETLTSLTIDLADFKEGHCQHLQKLRNLRFLDINRRFVKEPTCISDLGILPCFDILVDLRLRWFSRNGTEDHCRQYLQSAFSRMRCLECLHMDSNLGHTGEMLDSLDYLHKDAPLRELHWINLHYANQDSVFQSYFPEYDDLQHKEQLQEIKRLPEMFPNVTDLEIINFLPERCDSPFEHVQKLKLCLGTNRWYPRFPRCVLRQNIESGIFPNLRKLCFSPDGNVETFLLCRELMKLELFEQFDAEKSFDTAKRASFARSLCPFVRYELPSLDEKEEEWLEYRNRRTNWWTSDASNEDVEEYYEYNYENVNYDNEGDDGGDHDDGSEEHAGTRRQRD